MKAIRVCLVLGFVLFAGFSVFAQSSSAAANRRTAERCLSLSENFMLNSDWQNALNQAELGLSYDDSISDLFYVKAASQSNLGVRKADVIETIKESFAKDNWVNYTKNSARILYADMLSDTGLYDQSLAILDSEPLLYSADSEFIRIKNYYRLGTTDSIAQARTRLNSSRKIYPKDERFPKLFFMFEFAFMSYAERTGTPYEVPEIVRTITNSYTVSIPDYSSANVESEILALMFCEPEQQKRLLKAVGEKNQNNPTFAYAGLKTGVISEEKAFNLFFDSSNGSYSLGLLEDFGLLLKDEELIQNFKQRIASLEGTVYIDNDLDLQSEIVVTYERGRARTISYDKNMDGILEIFATCDFGAPVSLFFSDSKLDLFYEFYPYVSRVVDNTSGNVYHFLTNEYSYNPFEMTVDTLFSRYEVEFFVPYIDQEIEIPDEFMLAKNASSLEVATKERRNSRVSYTIFEGCPVYAVFLDSGSRYAYASIENSYPFVRYVDYDNDGVYETSETFDMDTENKYSDAQNVELIKNIFGSNTFSEKLYLKKVQIDRDGNTIVEFSEEYLGYNGKISSWDADENGVLDYEYIRYPDGADGVLLEETIIYNENGDEYLSIKNQNGVPTAIRSEGKDVEVFKGQNENFFWIEEKGGDLEETAILNNVSGGVEQGAVRVVQPDDAQRFSVIKVGNGIFCKKLYSLVAGDEE
ncbi:MAG: hypothetical protein K5907_01045 [Treponema sp.]|nr:hypothetical protein [Treponema sp.]